MVSRNSIGRRGFLAGAAAAGAAAAATGAGAASASAAPSGTTPRAGHAAAGAPQAGGPRSALNRSDRAFLEHGLIHAAWVRSGSEDGWFPDAQLWKDSGFTTPHFYGEQTAESALGYVEYSEEVMRGPNKHTWALANAPEHGALRSRPLPDPEADWLTEAMAANTDTLFSVCYGDEEPEADDLIDYLAAAFAKSHRELPHVLVHNNQALGQYPGAVLEDYVRRAKPDLISWDWYIWMNERQWAGESPTPLYTTLGRYRRAALAGTDGTGADPIAFGQYTTGFRLQPEIVEDTDRYRRTIHVSESQLNLLPYSTWAAGGKWLSLFRWELDEPYLPWETDGLFLTDADENPLPSFHRYVRINADMTAFSPFLTRLRTHAVARLPGLTADGGATDTPESSFPDFTPAVDPGSGVVDLDAANLGSTNGGQRGDVILGTFRPIPGLSARENRAVLPDRTETPAFMLVNGLTAYNTDNTDPFGTGGSGEQTRQAITVTVDVPKGTELYRVVQQGRGHRRVELRPVDGKRQFTVELDGGAGALYFWG